MKSVMLSIQPKWCELIASGKKTIEVRKSAPKLETPFKCYIYETKGKKVECGFHFEETGRTLRDKYVFGMHEARIVKHYRNEGKGKVIGEFMCDKVLYFPYMTNPANEHEKVHWISQKKVEETCLTYKEFENYGKGKTLYGWHISDLKIYDKPKELSEFVKTDKDDYCDINCKHLKIKGKPLSACDRYCDKYETYLFYNDSFIRCNDCFMDDCVITKAPQSWGYCEELER